MKYHAPLTGILGVASGNKDVVKGQRRIRVCGVVLVPDDYPVTSCPLGESDGGWEKWVVEVTILPIKKFTLNHGHGATMDDIAMSLGPDDINMWTEKEA